MNIYEDICRVEDLCPSSLLVKKAKQLYGRLERKSYFSSTCENERFFNVLYPVNYDAQEKYPVLYLLHGIFGDENTFVKDEALHIREFFGNMQVKALCKKMIVIFPNIFATKDKNLKPSFSNEAVAAYDNFINELTQDLMPFVEANLNVKTGRENTAICGFSMGGRETLFISIKKPKLASYVGAIAPAPGLVPSKDWAMEHKGMLEKEEMKFSEPLKLLMLTCGSKDLVVGNYPLTYHKIFSQNGIKHFWYEIQDADHDNNAILSGLFHFLQFTFMEER